MDTNQTQLVLEARDRACGCSEQFLEKLSGSVVFGTPLLVCGLCLV